MILENIQTNHDALTPEHGNVSCMAPENSKENACEATNDQRLSSDNVRVHLRNAWGGEQEREFSVVQWCSCIENREERVRAGENTESRRS